MSSHVIRLKQLFEEAVSSTSGEREAFLREACAADAALHNELSSLLEAYDASSGFFEKLAEDLIVPAFAALELEHEDATGPDRNVSHYALLERIRDGGMGVVYKARDTRLGRTVALKFLHRRHASNPGARARLLAEARAVSALDHPNIAVVYEIGEADDGTQFIAMAWYEGETLKDIARRGPLAVAQAVTIAEQIGRALAAAHRAGIIHRDVKPANVMVTQSGAVKLLDFGIAKLMSADDGEMHPAAGTIPYMSPEQTRNAAIDERTDIWSLGVLLYEMLAGQRPFKRQTDELLISAIRNEEPPLLSSISAEVPARLAAIVERCLQKNSADRYQSAEELCTALSEWDSEAAAPFSLRDYRIPIAASLLFLVATAAAIWSYARYSQDTPVTTSAGNEQPISVAVLPLSDSGDNDSSRYVAVGLSDELRGELSRISRVTVPSYLSSASYARTAKPITQVAREMGANFVVAGAVDASGSQVNLRAMDGKTGGTLWSRSYKTNPAMSMIIRDATKHILASVGVSLWSDETRELNRAPTSNPRAYDLYLRGRYAELTAMPRHVLAPTSVESIRGAQALYAQARSLDPNFALARARLASSHMFSATRYDTTRARLDQARLEAETALRLDSGLAEAHDALSAYWSRSGNQAKAIEELEIALRAEPNNAGLLSELGTRYVAAGRWEESVAQLERAMRLDPRNPSVAFKAAVTYGRLRQRDKAMRAFNRVIDVSPDDYNVRVIKGHSYLRWTGSPDTLDAALRSIPPQWDDYGMATYGRYTVLRVRRRYRDVLTMLDRTPTELSWDGLIYHPKSLMRAEMYKALGESRAAHVQYESARAILSDSSVAHPNDPSIHSALGLAYAGLGRKREAVEHADRAMQLVPVSANSMGATAFMGLAVEVFAHVGEFDRAFEMIELLLSMPSGREITVPLLRVWPGFDPLRHDPRFAKLIERFSAK